MCNEATAEWLQPINMTIQPKNVSSKEPCKHEGVYVQVGNGLVP